jgi:hypothetical protein
MELEFDGEMKVVTLGENLGVVKMAAMDSERERERERDVNCCKALKRESLGFREV